MSRWRDYYQKIKLRWYKLRLLIQDSRRWLTRDRSVVITTVTGALLAASIVVNTQYNFSGVLSIVFELIVPICQIILGSVFSIEILSYNTDPVDRDRLDPPAQVVQSYKEMETPGVSYTDQFIDLNYTYDGFYSQNNLRKLPAVPEAVPSHPVPTNEIEFRPTSEKSFYSLPDRAQKIFHPIINKIEKRFVDENHFNQMKVRPTKVSTTAFVGGKTTFFNNFACNLCADWNVFNSRTPRDLLHPLVFDSNGRLRDLDETPMPYIAASSGLIFSKSGQTVLPVRSGNVVIQGRQLGESFGGSWDWDIIQQDGVEGQISREYTTERESVESSFYHLGTMRRVDLMGKPDTYLLGYTDDKLDWEESSPEHLYPVVVDILPENETFDSYQEIINNASKVTESILQVVSSAPFQPSHGLLIWL